MALITCKECGKDVSDKAKTCAGCGAPVKLSIPKKKAHPALVGIVALGIIYFAFGGGKGGASKPAAPSAEGSRASAASCAAADLTCLGNAGVSAASVYCRREVEKLAKYDFKWTDGFLESKFDRFRWKDKNSGVITYLGDKVQFQNGFGAFTTVTYECDLAKDNKTVLDVRAKEGRLN
ncbi:zinc ribbon domain-containing protein [Achromobacter sp. Marseille-Q0513]|uniref:zinc ribbon domain-containing protein n=1 Tax=Achromobacter sp. Marseille-Q0513 TaxID=2829161 RepID=UPI001B9F8C2B|nr:zinc ribbon domain-containing protein [Achromobacter sp. Marseille-Q0513]MBR8654225.1 zinc ribbon domain-containing protein [Achromobacter sp. Marseille-Q0513]